MGTLFTHRLLTPLLYCRWSALALLYRLALAARLASSLSISFNK
ncbi:hypothetical protein HMPREF0372_00811 [Flavonifractor plautii ATCC 29863]|uniref:Uncharacterized protein n=1 Tax=Flavonifractor plautii ATCC 29863 TaxID=411475 RepID=G9YMU0_FLAPL|nr:hypothetical protein HMPREF0372_00811 [Flavonifractor plautii ATCC 29863]